jgi:hypothetical protein
MPPKEDKDIQPQAEIFGFNHIGKGLFTPY